MGINIENKGLSRIMSFCFAILIFGAFGQVETNTNLIEIGELYSIEIPDFMESSKSLNEDASLQYNNLVDEKYVIVIDESKQEFIEIFRDLEMYDNKKSVIENYAEQQYNFMAEGSEIKSESEYTELVLNGLPVIRKNFDADVAGVPQTVSYFFAFVEGDESLYMIMAWTLESVKDDYANEVNGMINSFRENNGSRSNLYPEEVVANDEEELAEFIELLEEDETPTEHDLVETKSPDGKHLNVKVNSLYEVTIPSFMKSSTSLNDDASLQYNNLYKEKYMIVIDEDKQEFIDVFTEIGTYDKKKSIIDNYAGQQYDFMSEGSAISFESKMEKMKLKGLNARKKSFDADVEGVPAKVSYFFGFVEGKKTLYMIMAWTLESKKADFELEAQEIMESFKEL